MCRYYERMQKAPHAAFDQVDKTNETNRVVELNLLNSRFINGPDNVSISIYLQIVSLILISLYNFGLLKTFLVFFQAVAPISDDDDGHLAYKLGDVIEHENHRCKRVFHFSP